MKSFKIGNLKISKNTRPIFIADIAANHDGDLNRAYILIEKAKESGADIAKFQNFKADKIVSNEGFNSLNTQLSHQKTWEKSIFEVYSDAALPEDWTSLLKEKCKSVGIEYMTSPYDFESIDIVDKYVNAYKIGSGDITWTEIISYMAKKKKPVFLATGASTMEDVMRAMDILQKNNIPNVLMQCNTNYTADPSNFKYLNLNVLKTYAEIFPNSILGLSDHTKGHSSVLGAIALGASVIEKHFTDDNSRPGPDHKFSITPEEWKEMVYESYNLFNALGDGIKKVEDNEKETFIVQRRSFYYNRNIKRGDILLEDDIIPLRPALEDSYFPYENRQIIGRKLNRDVFRNTNVKRSDFE